MLLPPFLGNVIALLLALMTPAALGCLVLAGLCLRTEGGIDFQIGGSFLRYILWAAIFLTMQGIGTWFASLGLSLNGFNNGFGTGELAPIAAVVTRFVQDVVLAHLVPVIAAALVLKAILDIGEGHNPLASIISALFLFGIQGLFTIFQGWNDGSGFATTDFLVNAWNYLASQLCPLAASLAIGGAVLAYVRNRNWMRYAASSFGLLTVSRALVPGQSHGGGLVKMLNEKTTHKVLFVWLILLFLVTTRVVLVTKAGALLVSLVIVAFSIWIAFRLVERRSRSLETSGFIASRLMRKPAGAHSAEHKGIGE